MSNLPIALKLKQEKKHLFRLRQKHSSVGASDALNSNINWIDDNIQSLQTHEENPDRAGAIFEVDLTGNITKISSSFLEKDKIQPLEESFLPHTKFTACSSKKVKLKFPNEFRKPVTRHSYSYKMDNAIDSYIPMSQKSRVPYFCRVCGMQCHDGEDFEKHMQSTTHREKERFDRQISFCHLCRKQFTSPDQLKEHKSGKWHQSRLGSRRIGSGSSVNHLDA
jgi:hypothetical protein